MIIKKTITKKYLRIADHNQCPPETLITSLKTNVVLKKAPERIPNKINLIIKVH
jgi:hypothetical protein